MPSTKTVAICVTSASFLGQAACSNDKIADATAQMQRQVASDVTVTLEPGSQKLYEPPGEFYFVCGMAVINQPGITNKEKQRFITSVRRDGAGGLTIFDGRKDADGKAAFRRQWDVNCK